MHLKKNDKKKSTATGCLRQSGMKLNIPTERKRTRNCKKISRPFFLTTTDLIKDTKFCLCQIIKLY